MLPYVHNIDPIITTIGGVHLWWYGFSFTLGFLNAHCSIRRQRERLGFSMNEVYSLSLWLAGGVLLGGRFVEVVFYEWPFYSHHLQFVPAYWLGGMATHGLLFGGLLGLWAFCRLASRPFLVITDALSVAAAVIMGLGRIGNFIDGQIVGSVTTVPWVVKFPDAEGFRHPVVLYDGLKNLLLVPVLVYARRRQLPAGVVTGLFLFLYAFLRIFVDLFREYPTSLLGLATGQVLNILCSILGLVLIAAPWWRRHRKDVAVGIEAEPKAKDAVSSSGIGWRPLLFAVILLLSPVIPSDSTQDIPFRYGKRHPGLEHSVLYPRIEAIRESRPEQED